MYPYVRKLKELWKFRSAPPLGLTTLNVQPSHVCVCAVGHRPRGWKLNNGRTLTLFEPGSRADGAAHGLHGILRSRQWGLPSRGNSNRYRKRGVRMFDRLEMRSRLLAGTSGSLT